MTLKDSWDWLASFTNLEKVQSATKRTWRLDRMDALLADRRHPERSELTLHLAGSKGKGSTAAFLSSILTASGRTTGLYASPHVSDWRERITRNGQFFDERTYTRTISGLKTYWESMDQAKKARFLGDWGGEPTTFEWLTLAAFELFTAEELDARVLETGLGGRLDATNAQVPTASILTLIELEHTDILGDTLALIAGEKAGILKPGVPAFVAPQKLEALEVFRKTAKALKAPLHSFDEEVEEFDTELSREGTLMRLGLADGTLIEAQLPLLGRAQGLNAAVAAWTIHGLVRDGRVELSPMDDLGDVIRTGLQSTTVPGRMQVLWRQPWVVLDGAHTAESAKLLARSWSDLFGPGGTLVFGAFEGKAVEPMAAALAPLFAHVIVTVPGTFRPSNPPALRQAFLDAPGSSGFVDLAATPGEALAAAVIDGSPVLVCGSFYLVGEILAVWEQILR
jgi:dihydrofolate synthase/folylpolyglutamate synthase